LKVAIENVRSDGARLPLTQIGPAGSAGADVL
jgi:hypothetical protein